MKEFISQLFSDGGKVSSKRFIAIIGALVLFTCILFVVFTGKKIDYHVYDGLIIVVLGAAGITAFEKVKGLPSSITDLLAKIPGMNTPAPKENNDAPPENVVQ